MGENTFVNDRSARAHKTAQPRPMQLRVDIWLVGAVAALAVFGILMVYSAGPEFALAEDLSTDYYLKRQLLWLFLGILSMSALSLFNYQYYRKLAVPLALGTVAVLLLVSIIGELRLGAIRGLINGSIQPSEMAKLVVIIYVAVWLNAKQDVLSNTWFGLAPLLMILGVNAGLILAQPDLSAALTVVLLGLVLFFLAGARFPQVALAAFITSAFGSIVISAFATGRDRFTNYINGLQDPVHAIYHVQRSLEAVINGGLFGRGIGYSSTKFTGLPVAPTDSIFAVIAEETGLIGIAFVIFLYLIILWRGIRIARQAPDMLGSLLAAGITIWIVLEAMMNMMVMVALLPHIGNALPLISYGGSSLLVTMTGLGILLNVGRNAVEKNAEEDKLFGSVVNLRWWNGRRRVSRANRPTSARL